MDPSRGRRVDLCRPPARLLRLPRAIKGIVDVRLRGAFAALAPTLEDYLPGPTAESGVISSDLREDTEKLHQRVERIDDLLGSLQPALRRLRHYAATRRRLRGLVRSSVGRYYRSLLMRVVDVWSCVVTARREEAFLWARMRTKVCLGVMAGVLCKWYIMATVFNQARLRHLSRSFLAWKRRSLGLCRLERWYDRRILLATIEAWMAWRGAFRWKLVWVPMFFASWRRLAALTSAVESFGKVRWQLRSLQGSLLGWRAKTAEVKEMKVKAASRQRRGHLLLRCLREFKRVAARERLRVRCFREGQLLTNSMRLWRLHVDELKHERVTAKMRTFVRWKLLTRRTGEKRRTRRLMWMLWRRQVVISRVLQSRERRRFRRTLASWRARVSEMRALRLCGGLIARRSAALAKRALISWWSWAVIRLLGRVAGRRREVKQLRSVVGQWASLGRAVKFDRARVGEATKIWLEVWVGRIRRHGRLAEGMHRRQLLRRAWMAYCDGVLSRVEELEARRRCAEEMAVCHGQALGRRALRWWKARINLR